LGSRNFSIYFEIIFDTFWPATEGSTNQTNSQGAHFAWGETDKGPLVAGHAMLPYVLRAPVGMNITAGVVRIINFLIVVLKFITYDVKLVKIIQRFDERRNKSSCEDPCCQESSSDTRRGDTSKASHQSFCESHQLKFGPMLLELAT